MSKGDTQETGVKVDGLKTYRKEFGHKVKSMRKQNGLSQEELAERSKLHRNYISDVERGQRNLSLDAILKLAMGLGIHIRELF